MKNKIFCARFNSNYYGIYLFHGESPHSEECRIIRVWSSNPRVFPQLRVATETKDNLLENSLYKQL